ncbi:MAG: hypothetical protein ACI378_11160 [Bacteroides sp.]
MKKREKQDNSCRGATLCALTPTLCDFNRGMTDLTHQSFAGTYLNLLSNKNKI